MGRALLSRLEELGIDNVVFLDADDIEARLLGSPGIGSGDGEASWRHLVSLAREDLQAGKIVIIAANAYLAAWRAIAREQLQPFFEVRLDCRVEVCVARDSKGHYTRALNDRDGQLVSGVFPYEDGNPELALDTGALTIVEAENLLTEAAVQFLATADGPNGLPAGYWVARLSMRMLVDKAPASLWEAPWLRNRMLRQAQKRKAYTWMNRPACAQLFVMFGGADVRSGSKDGDFTNRQLDLIKACGLVRRNLLYIRDPYLDNFFQGISDEVANPDDLAKWITSHAASLPHVSEAHAIGYSSGSYGALMFGHMCRLQTVWAFSPRTIRPTGTEAAMEHLRGLLSQHNGVTEYHVLYSAQNKRDRAFADVLLDCPNVTMHPYTEAGNDHMLMAYLAYTGELREILPKYRAVEHSSAGPDSGVGQT